MADLSLPPEYQDGGTLDFGSEDAIGWIAPWGQDMPGPGEPLGLLERIAWRERSVQP